MAPKMFELLKLSYAQRRIRNKNVWDINAEKNLQKMVWINAIKNTFLEIVITWLFYVLKTRNYFGDFLITFQVLSEMVYSKGRKFTPNCEEVELDWLQSPVTEFFFHNPVW